MTERDIRVKTSKLSLLPIFAKPLTLTLIPNRMLKEFGSELAPVVSKG